MGEFENVLIIGGSRGLGKALLKRYVERNTRSDYISRTQIPGNSKSVRHFRADLSTKEGIDFACNLISDEDYSHIYICAAWGPSDATQMRDASIASAAYLTNVIAPIAVANLALRRLERPRIYFISSLAASIPIPTYLLYGAHKKAVENFIQIDLKEKKNRWAIIRPGRMNTDFFSAANRPEEAQNAAQFENPDRIAKKITDARMGSTLHCQAIDRYIQIYHAISPEWLRSLLLRKMT